MLSTPENSMPRFTYLSDWLAWLETLHPSAIDLGLERVSRVAQLLQLLQPSTAIDYLHSGALAITGAQVFMVAGTNGKGSCVKTIEQCLLAQQYSVGTYTSPHLHHYCERIHIDGRPVTEELVCQAFAAIDAARDTNHERLSLTYFEFSTLAALWIFVQQQVPFVVLEVGLGGRLDAVNIVDADIAIITSIAVDHEEWLGSDREKIAIEKLGISRPDKPVVIAETILTKSLKSFACTHTSVNTLNQDFFVRAVNHSAWQWQSSAQARPEVLPLPALALTSVAAGLQALYLLDLLPPLNEVKSVLSALQLTGRYQTKNIRHRQIIFDVAHNPAAAQLLADKLISTQLDDQNTIAVFALMQDKVIGDIIKPLSGCFTCWYSGNLSGNDRAASASVISQHLSMAEQRFNFAESIESAFDSALSHSAKHDRIVVFGSFFTVAAIQQHVGMLAD
ncbi:MAG: dihydrofolate synthase/folylpolyglutamate synthase [Candidatus Endobugula sp.]